MAGVKAVDTVVLGAGMTGLAAGAVSGFPVFEGREYAGGICSSYYMRPGHSSRSADPPSDGEAYRFEFGGGHWIFGGDPLVVSLINSLVTTNVYHRRARVYFPDRDLYVPYPIQNHLSSLGKDIAANALAEIVASPRRPTSTMAEWIEQSFGSTLARIFFGPFHELYTAGLWRTISPQDAYKSPENLGLIIRGAFDAVSPVGYNVTFLYPKEGLNALVNSFAKKCTIHFGKTVLEIDTKNRQIYFADGSSILYRRILSTIPLDHVCRMAGVSTVVRADPYTSVLVFNIGGTKGPSCPDDHWLYIPSSKSGFHRVGFYSNVDSGFLPLSCRASHNKVSIYVEAAFKGGSRPTEGEISKMGESVVDELREWKFIENVDIVDPTWIDVAYTWSWPGSNWREQAIASLRERGIYQVGRYGRWVFQGIADSLRDGCVAGSSMAAAGTESNGFSR